MGIIYNTGNRSLSISDLVCAETDEEQLKVALRLLTESYDVHSFKTPRLAACTIVGHACGQDVIWEDFVSKRDYVEGTINLNGKEIDVYVEKSGGYADVLHVFDTEFKLIGVGAAYSFDWVSPPKFSFRSNKYHTYMSTEDELSRLVYPDVSEYRTMTLEDIELIRKRWAKSDSEGNATFGGKPFIMPQFR